MRQRTRSATTRQSRIRPRRVPRLRVFGSAPDRPRQVGGFQLDGRPHVVEVFGLEAWCALAEWQRQDLWDDGRGGAVVANVGVVIVRLASAAEEYFDARDVAEQWHAGL